MTSVLTDLTRADDRSGPSADTALQAIDAVKEYGAGDTRVRALDGITVAFDRGRLTAVMGPSGSGKSTLLHCLAGLDDLTAGRVLLGDTEVTALSDADRTELRRDRIGFIFQSFNLLPTLTAEENIVLPIRLAGRKIDRDRFDRVVAAIGIGDRLAHRPSELSGGQQQRVAAARALIGHPEVVFADEPTGNLDSRAGAQLLQLLRQAVDDEGHTIVMVTHDPKAAATADRVVFLADGRLAGEIREPDADGIIDAMKQLGG